MLVKPGAASSTTLGGMPFGSNPKSFPCHCADRLNPSSGSCYLHPGSSPEKREMPAGLVGAWAPWVVTLVSVPIRLTHDISLEEFEDEDLSEITDECGISLQCKDTLSLLVRARRMGTKMRAPQYLQRSF